MSNSQQNALIQRTLPLCEATLGRAPVGAEIGLQLNYSALVRAMTSMASRWNSLRDLVSTLVFIFRQEPGNAWPTSR